MSQRAEFKGDKKTDENFRLFPTPRANEDNYPFNKPHLHFYDRQKFTLDVGDYHWAFTTKKIPKTEMMDSPRDKAVWYEIHNELCDSKYHDRHLAFVVFSGELFSLELGSDVHPKYRVVKNRKSNCYVSKGLQGYVTLSKFLKVLNDTEKSISINKMFTGTDLSYMKYHYRRTHLRNPHCKSEFDARDYLENTGRIIFNKWQYHESDLTSSNLMVDLAKQTMAAIDPGLSFCTFTSKFLAKHYRGNFKQVTYSLKNHSHLKELEKINGEVEFLESDQVWDVRSKSYDYIGELSGKDYDETLPYVKYFVPHNWIFNVYVNYSEFLADYVYFRNEKHFSAIKSQVTKQLKHALVDIHVVHAEDNLTLHEIVTKNLKDVLLVLSQSKEFLSYLQTFRMVLMPVILFEILEFLQKNKHYRYLEEEDAFLQWKKISELVIGEFAETLVGLKQAALSDKEKMSLLECAGKLYRKDPLVIGEVFKFYKNQGMAQHAAEVQSRYTLTLPKVTQPQQGFFSKLVAQLDEDDAPGDRKESSCVIA